MQVLQDKSRKMVCLFNCRLSPDGSALFCGVAVFRGGLGGEINVFGTNNEVYRIRIPDYVLANNTYIARANHNDVLPIEIISKK